MRNLIVSINIKSFGIQKILFVSTLFFSSSHLFAETIIENDTKLSLNNEQYLVSYPMTINDLIQIKGVSLKSLQEVNNYKYLLDDKLTAGTIIILPSDITILHSQLNNQNNLPSLGNQSSSQSSTSQKFLNIQTQDPDLLAAETTQYLIENDLTKDDLKNVLSNQVENYKQSFVNDLNQNANEFLGNFGKSNINVALSNGNRLESYQASLLMPILENDNSLFYTQLNFGKFNSDRTNSNIGNFGLGYRYINQNYILGGNLFFDQDFTKSHNRLGIGSEYWLNYLKFSSNYYIPISNWKNASEIAEHQQKPAKGFDIRSQAYLPAYPQLGTQFTFEQYFGDEVASISKKERSSDPYILAAGINYTPIPLITFEINSKQDSAKKSETNFALNLNLKLNESIDKQLDASQLVSTRSLIGSRYDLVDRNNEIIYEYRQQLFELKIQPEIIKEKYPVDEPIKITSSHSSPSEIKNYEWRVTPIGTETTENISAMVFTPKKPGRYIIYQKMQNQNGITVESNRLIFEVVDVKNEFNLAIDFYDRTTDPLFMESDISLEPDTAFKRTETAKSFNHDEKIEFYDLQYIHFSVSAFKNNTPYDVKDKLRISYQVGDKWVQLGADAENLEIIKSYADPNDINKWHYIVTSKGNVPDAININASLYETEAVAVATLEFVDRSSYVPPNQFRITLTEKGQNGLSNGELVLDTNSPTPILKSLKQDTYYEVTVYEKINVKKSASKLSSQDEWKDITSQVQHSITWRYWDPTSSQQNDNLSVFEEGAYGLEACRGYVLFSTQTNNFINNEMSWGKLGANALLVTSPNNPETSKLTEQNLQLAVQFNKATRIESNTQVDKKLCNDEIKASPAYVDYMVSLAKMKPTNKK